MTFAGPSPRADWTARSVLRMFGLSGGTGRQVSSVSAILGLYRMVIASPRRLQTYQGYLQRPPSWLVKGATFGGKSLPFLYLTFHSSWGQFFRILLVETHMGSQLVVVE